MHDAGQVLGFFAAALLIIAIGAWVRLIRRPRLQRLDGRRPPTDGVETASQLLVAALCVSAVAAILAVVGVFSH
jgi:hypothetical protein